MLHLPKAPGLLVTVGSHRLHVQQMGEGIPIIFEAGAGEWSTHWELVSELLPAKVRAIRYDRAGIGWSDFATGNRSISTLTQELNTLLNVLEVSEPIILVAHSFGASIARLFAHQFPNRIKGIVFVDGWHESFSKWELQNSQFELPSWVNFLHLFMARTGILRLINTILPTPKPQWPISKHSWLAMLGISATAKYFAACQNESKYYAENDLNISTITKLPIRCIALVARETISISSMPKGYPISSHNHAWLEASSRLAELTSNKEIRIIENTDHMLQLNRPEIVADAVRDLL